MLGLLHLKLGITGSLSTSRSNILNRSNSASKNFLEAVITTGLLTRLVFSSPLLFLTVLLIVKDAVLFNLLKAVGSGHAPAVRRGLDRQREDYPNPFRYWALSSAVLWVIFLLIAYLFIFYLRKLSRG